MRKWSVTLLMATFLLLASGLAGCGSSPAKHAAMADAGSMPAEVQAAPQSVQLAYRFAAANPDTLKQIPCYCGCGGMGHLSNYNCFWQAEGQVDTHALGCGICVDIASDVRRGLEKGLPLARIRAEVDANYSRFGPPTDTPAVAARAE